jgi:adenosylcobinamide-phosphate synthase
VAILDSLFPILSDDGWKLGLLAVTLAYILDLLFGDPKWLYGRLPHPIIWMGALINILDRRLRNPKASLQQQTMRGITLVAIMVGLSLVAGNAIAWLAYQTGYGWIILGVIGSVFFATRSLHDHVAAVTSGLEQGMDQGRDAVGHIVGRDPEDLDEAGIARAAVESLAENFADGVVAPMFWFLLCGLPGLLAYKAINTMDSMIGHRSERYLYFGQFAARLDDAANWPGARIAGLLICLGALVSPNAGANARRAWHIMGRDHGLHNSPNAGWPEGAMAGALDIALAGPRSYGGMAVNGAWIGDGGKREATHLDIRRACVVYRGTCAIIAFALVAAAFL